MLIDNDHDLGLSLGLSSSNHSCSIQLNIMPPNSPSPQFLQSNPRWSDNIRSQSERKTALGFHGIDVNRSPVTELVIDEDVATSPNSTVSTGSAGEKRRYEACDGVAGGGEEIEADRACSRGLSDEDDGEGSRKKLRLSKDRLLFLKRASRRTILLLRSLFSTRPVFITTRSSAGRFTTLLAIKEFGRDWSGSSLRQGSRCSGRRASAMAGFTR